MIIEIEYINTPHGKGFRHSAKIGGLYRRIITQAPLTQKEFEEDTRAMFLNLKEK